MPLHKMSLEGDVFFAKAVGYLDNMDGRMWANALQNHVGGHLLPMAAIIDMIEVDRICPTVTKIVAESIKLSNLRGIAIVVNPTMASQNTRVIDKLSEMSGVSMFSSMEDARRYANNRLTLLIGSSLQGATFTAFAMSSF